jgi:hypothetical protein
MGTTSTCTRCGRTVSVDDAAYLEWEALGEHGQEACGDCITAEERQAVDEGVMNLADTTPLGDAGDPRGDASDPR